MSMTRKHYQQVADTIRGCDSNLFSEDELDTLCINLNVFKTRLGELFVPIFKADNPRFKAAMFLKRCSHEDPFYKDEIDFTKLWGGYLEATGAASEGLDDICDLDSITEVMEKMSKKDKRTAVRYIKNWFYPDGLHLMYTQSPYIGFNLCRYYYREKKAAEIAVLLASIDGRNPKHYGETTPPHVEDYANAPTPYWTAVTG